MTATTATQAYAHKSTRSLIPISLSVTRLVVLLCFTGISLQVAYYTLVAAGLCVPGFLGALCVPGICLGPLCTGLSRCAVISNSAAAGVIGITPTPPIISPAMSPHPVFRPLFLPPLLPHINSPAFLCPLSYMAFSLPAFITIPFHTSAYLPSLVTL